MTRPGCPGEAGKAKCSSPGPVEDAEIVWRAFGKPYPEGGFERWFTVAELLRQELSVDRESIMPFADIVASQRAKWAARSQTLAGLMKCSVADVRAIESDLAKDVFCVHDDGDEEQGPQHATIGFCFALRSQGKNVLRPLRDQLMNFFRQNPVPLS